MADPSMIRVGDHYYATGTSSEWAPFYPVFTSTDMVNWEQTGHVFEEKPEWTSHSFWAPELYYHNGTMFCYYSARRKTDNVTYIGVASAVGTSLQFKDHGPIVELGTEAIDAFVFDNNGQLYLSWKAYGLDQRPIELLASKLSFDGLRLEGEPFSLLKDDEGIGLEGQYHFKEGDYYYIIYSAKSCCGPSSDYDVRVARATSFQGPYEKYEGNPILSGGNGKFMSIGHGTVAETPDGRRFYLSHGYQTGDEFYLGRQPVLHELTVEDDGWVHFVTGKHGSIRQSAPFDNIIQKRDFNFSDDFTGKEPKVDWTWNYPYSEISATVEHGMLELTGNSFEGNNYGTVMCLRPRTVNYAYQTKINTVNDSFKGLTMYGDNKNLLAFGVVDERIELRLVKEGNETILFQNSPHKMTSYFKVDVLNGRFLTFLYSEDGHNWSTVNETPLDVTYLVRWDRVARPGLIHIGDFNQPALIDYFVLENKVSE